MKGEDLRQLLEEKTALYNQPSFIELDPVSIPHAFSKKQDREISGFFAATLAWGIRKTIINKCRELMGMMGNAPHDFVLNYTERDLVSLLKFKHRTFNSIDLVYFLEFFQWFYRENDSLETAFSRFITKKDESVENGLVGFHDLFFSLPQFPQRTKKHVATPERNSSCKRLNMYLRWMVRSDEKGVDFGIWKKIRPDQLVCPVDIHVERVARHLGLIQKPQVNWSGALELTRKLKDFDPRDPVKYDFALFGLGVMEGVK
jgi:uncharacterized protein (TIGR02757 family)